MIAPLDALRLFAHEFQNVPDETVEQWIEITGPLVSQKRFGALYAQAVALLAAHRMKLAGLGEDTLGDIPITGIGGVASYAEGAVSVSFNTSQQTNTTTDAELGLTAYGTQFLTLRRSRIVPIISSGEG